MFCFKKTFFILISLFQFFDLPAPFDETDSAQVALAKKMIEDFSARLDVLSLDSDAGVNIDDFAVDLLRKWLLEIKENPLFSELVFWVDSQDPSAGSSELLVGLKILFEKIRILEPLIVPSTPCFENTFSDQYLSPRVCGESASPGAALRSSLRGGRQPLPSSPQGRSVSFDRDAKKDDGPCLVGMARGPKAVDRLHKRRSDLEIAIMAAEARREALGLRSPKINLNRLDIDQTQGSSSLAQGLTEASGSLFHNKVSFSSLAPVQDSSPVVVLPLQRRSCARSLIFKFFSLFACCPKDSTQA